MLPGTIRAGGWTAKLLALLLVLACLVIGVIGIVVPVIPGLLFLAIAALIVARHSPSMERRLRRNATLRGYLDRADAMLDLPLTDKLRAGALLCVRMLIDGIVVFFQLVAWLWTATSDTRRRAAAFSRTSYRERWPERSPRY